MATLFDNAEFGAATPQPPEDSFSGELSRLAGSSGQEVPNDLPDGVVAFNGRVHRPLQAVLESPAYRSGSIEARNALLNEWKRSDFNPFVSEIAKSKFGKGSEVAAAARRQLATWEKERTKQEAGQDSALDLDLWDLAAQGLARTVGSTAATLGRLTDTPAIERFGRSALADAERIGRESLSTATTNKQKLQAERATTRYRDAIAEDPQSPFYDRLQAIAQDYGGKVKSIPASDPALVQLGREFDEAGGLSLASDFVAGAQDFLAQPANSTASMFGSFAPAIAASAIPGVGLPAVVAASAASTAGEVGQGVYDQVMALPPDVLARNPRYAELLTQFGDTPQGRVDAADALATEVSRTPALAGLGLGAASGVVGRLFGLESLTDSAIRRAAVRGATGRAARAGTEIVQESAEEGITQLLQNLGVQGADPTQRLGQGVGSAAAQGALGGGIVAGAAVPFTTAAAPPGGVQDVALDAGPVAPAGGNPSVVVPSDVGPSDTGSSAAVGGVRTPPDSMGAGANAGTVTPAADGIAAGPVGTQSTPDVEQFLQPDDLAGITSIDPGRGQINDAPVPGISVAPATTQEFAELATPTAGYSVQELQRVSDIADSVGIKLPKGVSVDFLELPTELDSLQENTERQARVVSDAANRLTIGEVQFLRQSGIERIVGVDPARYTAEEAAIAQKIRDNMLPDLALDQLVAAMWEGMPAVNNAILGDIDGSGRDASVRSDAIFEAATSGQVGATRAGDGSVGLGRAAPAVAGPDGGTTGAVGQGERQVSGNRPTGEVASASNTIRRRSRQDARQNDGEPAPTAVPESTADGLGATAGTADRGDRGPDTGSGASENVGNTQDQLGGEPGARPGGPEVGPSPAGPVDVEPAQSLSLIPQAVDQVAAAIRASGRDAAAMRVVAQKYFETIAENGFVSQQDIDDFALDVAAVRPIRDAIDAGLETIDAQERALLRTEYNTDTDRLRNDLVAMAENKRTTLDRVLGTAKRAVKAALRSLLNAIMAVSAVFTTSAVVSDQAVWARGAVSEQAATFAVIPAEVLSEMSPAARIVLGTLATDADFKTNLSFVADKPNARVYVFDKGVYVTNTPALFGKDQGDVNVKPSRTPLSDFGPGDKVTPAGKFRGTVENDIQYGRVVYLNGGAGDVAIHVNKSRLDNRDLRLKSPAAADNRVTFGCINVDQDFYDSQLSKLDVGANPFVFVVPEEASLVGKFFNQSLQVPPAVPPTGPNRIIRNPLRNARRVVNDMLSNDDRLRTEAQFAQYMSTGERPVAPNRARSLQNKLIGTFIDNSVDGVEAINAEVTSLKGRDAKAGAMLEGLWTRVLNAIPTWRNSADLVFDEQKKAIADPWMQQLRDAARRLGVDAEALGGQANIYAQMRDARTRTQILETRLVDAEVTAQEVVDNYTALEAAVSPALRNQLGNLTSRLRTELDRGADPGRAAALIFEATALGTEIVNALSTAGEKRFDGLTQLIRGLASWSDFQPTKKAAFDAVSGANKLLVQAQDLLSGLTSAEATLDRAKKDVDLFEKSQNDPLIVEVVDGVRVERLAGGKLPGGFRKSLINSVLGPVDQQVAAGDPRARAVVDLANGLVTQFEKLQDAAVANGIATQQEVDSYRALHTATDASGKKIRTYVSFMGDSARDIDDIQGVSINRSFVDESDGATRVGQPAPSLVNLTAKIRQLANRVGQKDMREALLEIAKTEKSTIVKFATASQDRTENYYKVFAGGDVERIKILNDDVAESLFYIPSVASNLGKAATMGTTTYGRLFTQYVAAFAPINAFRDAATRAFNFVGRKELSSKEVTRARAVFLNNLFGTSAAKTWSDAWDFAIKDKSSADLDEARRNGAILLFTESLVSEADVNKQMQALNPSAWNSIKANAVLVHSFVERWNKLFEVAIPLATYKALKSVGKEGRQAAAITSDMMNFRAKGEATKYFAAVYPFFNATAQDIRQTGRSLSTRRGQIEFAGLVAVAGLLYAMVRESDEDDELTGGKKIDGVSVSNQERNLMLRVPGTDTYVNIPIGFGAVQLAWVAGMRSVRAAAGIDNPADAMLDVGKAVVKSLSPVGASEIAFTKDPTGWLAQTFTPALVKPIGSVAMNKNFMGSPITYARANGQTFKSEQGNFATPEFFKDVAQGLRKTTGFDMAPEQVRELMSGYLAGPAAGLMALANDRSEKNLPSRPDMEGGLGAAIKAFGVNRVYRPIDETATTYSLENKYADEALAVLRRTNTKVPAGTTRLKGQERIEREVLRVIEAGEEDNAELVRAYLEYQFAASKLQRAKGTLRREPDADIAQIGEIERERLALMREFIQRVAQQ